ncbi:MAG: dethiobiotin synthase [Tepidisphaerales bacterium]
MIPTPSIPGLFITGTSTGVGKTIITGAIARWLRADGRRVAVCKPVATGCVRRREGTVSEDAEYLAHCADTPHPLDLVCPVRYLEPLAPAVAAERAKTPVDFEAIARSLRIMTADADVLLVEGIGGILVPLDATHTVLDLARALNYPAVIVADAVLGTINHTLLTLQALRCAEVPVAGVVINRYPPGTPGLAEETNPRAIEKFGHVPILAIVPQDTIDMSPATGAPTPRAIAAAIAQADWWTLATKDRNKE